MSNSYESSKQQEELFKASFNKESRVFQMAKVQKEGLELFTKKNADYGDAFANYGPVGVIVRLGDKIQRLSSVSKNGVTLVNNESLRDTLIDLHNYAAMAIMLIDEKSENVWNLYREKFLSELWFEWCQKKIEILFWV